MPAEVPAATIKSLARIINELRVIEADFPASYAAVFLFVAAEEAAHKQPPALSEVADSLGLERSLVSRASMAMSNRRLGGRDDENKRATRKALGLLERIPDDVDLRLLRVRLSAKGRGLLQRMAENVK